MKETSEWRPRREDLQRWGVPGCADVDVAAACCMILYEVQLLFKQRCSRHQPTLDLGHLLRFSFHVVVVVSTNPFRRNWEGPSREQLLKLMVFMMGQLRTGEMWLQAGSNHGKLKEMYGTPSSAVWHRHRDPPTPGSDLTSVSI